MVDQDDGAAGSGQAAHVGHYRANVLLCVLIQAGERRSQGVQYHQRRAVPLNLAHQPSRVAQRQLMKFPAFAALTFDDLSVISCKFSPPRTDHTGAILGWLRSLVTSGVEHLTAPGSIAVPALAGDGRGDRLLKT